MGETRIKAANRLDWRLMLAVYPIVFLSGFQSGQSDDALAERDPVFLVFTLGQSDGSPLYQTPIEGDFMQGYC